MFQDLVPVVDPDFQPQFVQQTDIGSDNFNGKDTADVNGDDFIDCVETRTSSDVLVTEKKKSTVTKTRSQKKKVGLSDIDVPNQPACRVICSGVKFMALKGTSSSLSDDYAKKTTSFLNVKMSFKKKMFAHLIIKVEQEEVLSKSDVPNFDDESGGLQLSFVGKDKVHSGFCEGNDEGYQFTYDRIKVDQSILDLVDNLTRAHASPESKKTNQWELVSIPESISPPVDDAEVLDVVPLQSRIAAKRQAKLGVHCRSSFVNEFGSCEPKDQKKKDNEHFFQEETNPSLSFYRLVDKSYLDWKSILFDANVKKRVMTTHTYFDATLKGVYDVFIKAKLDPSVIRNDLSLDSGPYVVPKDTPIAYEFVDKLPTQSSSDCGMFVIKYVDLFIREKIHEIPPNMGDIIANYRDDIAVTLYNYI
uniref:Ubiquitin-like protease family profile domain-containing protein n=1 Tax=Cannabis sativa TaxID=3483 RepID=A0A803NI78_CANSA